MTTKPAGPGSRRIAENPTTRDLYDLLVETRAAVEGLVAQMEALGIPQRRQAASEDDRESRRRLMLTRRFQRG